MQEIYVFCGELCWKRLCWHVNCAETRLSQRAKIQEISCWEDIEEAILISIYIFIVISSDAVVRWQKLRAIGSFPALPSWISSVSPLISCL